MNEATISDVICRISVCEKCFNGNQMRSSLSVELREPRNISLHSDSRLFTSGFYKLFMTHRFFATPIARPSEPFVHISRAEMRNVPKSPGTLSLTATNHFITCYLLCCWSRSLLSHSTERKLSVNRNLLNKKTPKKKFKNELEIKWGYIPRIILFPWQQQTLFIFFTPQPRWIM